MSFKIKTFTCLLFITIIYSCYFSNEKLVNEIIIAFPVQKDNYFSEESEITINSQRYSMRYKILYDNGNIKNFIKYYPDGPIVYTIEELKKDTAIYSSIQIPLNQNWKIDEKPLRLLQKGQSINLIKLDDFHYKDREGNRILVTK